MCLSEIRCVTALKGDTAVMDDQRHIKLGGLRGVKPGSYLEVFADIAVRRLTKRDAELKSFGNK